MEVSSISQVSLPTYAVSAESWPASCVLCLKQKCKDQTKTEENIFKSKCLKTIRKSW